MENTKDAINWFNSIKNKQNCTFIAFDVESFYPSISCNLFEKAILFAKQYAKITQEEMNIIMQARKTFLFYNELPWIKKMKGGFRYSNGRCFDGAECCEEVGSYKLNLLGDLIDKNSIGLYRDDGLGIFENLSGPQIERQRKRF